jgi:hypothetical protein
MVKHGGLILSSFSAGKHSGLSPKYESQLIALHCEHGEHILHPFHPSNLFSINLLDLTSKVSYYLRPHIYEMSSLQTRLESQSIRRWRENPLAQNDKGTTARMGCKDAGGSPGATVAGA